MINWVKRRRKVFKEFSRLGEWWSSGWGFLLVLIEFVFLTALLLFLFMVSIIWYLFHSARTMQSAAVWEFQSTNKQNKTQTKRTYEDNKKQEVVQQPLVFLWFLTKNYLLNRCNFCTGVTAGLKVCLQMHRSSGVCFGYKQNRHNLYERTWLVSWTCWLYCLIDS